MRIHLAEKADMPGIRELAKKYQKTAERALPDSLVNKRDVALVAHSDTGECVGFIWAGFMRKNEVAYVDHFVVSPDHARKGVGNALARELFKQCWKRGAREGFAVIRHDEHHNKSAMNCLKMAASADPSAYTFVQMDAPHMLNELRNLGV